jgi:hypothetical protein
MLGPTLSRRERVGRVSGRVRGTINGSQYFFILYPSSIASRHLLPSGEGFARNLCPHFKSTSP